MTKPQFNQMVAGRGFINLIIYYTNQFKATHHINYSYNPFAVEKSIAISRALAKLKKFTKTRGEDVMSWEIHTESELDY